MLARLISVCRITSYNVCYTKLLRSRAGLPAKLIDGRDNPLAPVTQACLIPDAKHPLQEWRPRPSESTPYGTNGCPQSYNFV